MYDKIHYKLKKKKRRNEKTSITLEIHIGPESERP